MVLFEYDHLESIPDDAADWNVKVRGAEKLAATLCAHREEAALYRALTTLRRDVPLAESLGDLRWRGVVMSEFEPLCRELGFESLLERDLPVAD